MVIQNIFVLTQQTSALYNITPILIQMNPYQVLQLPETATYQQIKQRYRHLSKMVHPDKHPIENYQIAQAHFKQIDEAYKSISNDLRRNVYKHYGPPGITIIENNHFLFQEFEQADLDNPVVRDKLNQLMMYCLLEEHASNQIDKNSLGNKSVLMVFKPINQTNQLPSVDRFEFSFETSLPDFWGMSHTASINHESQGLNSQTKSNMSYGIGSSKRITQTLMFTSQTQFSSQKFVIQAGIDKNINNNLVLHFIPINFMNGQLGGLQVGADFHRDSYYISGITDFRDFTVQIGSTPANKKVSKNIKLAFDGNSFMVYPTYQRQITSRLRMFVQFHCKGQQEVTEPNHITARISLGIAYGYKLKLMEELKLELVSYLNPSQSNFQIGIITPKFRTTIPIFSRGDMIRFQLFKLGAFVGVYLGFELYNYYIRRSQRRRKRIQYQNYNRLSVQKNVVSKNNSDYSIAAAQSMARQVKYTGLVVLLSYLGSANSIANLKSKIKRSFDIGKNHQKLPELIEKAKDFIRETPTNQDNFAEELYEITESVQSEVQGSQLLGYNVEELRVNPCMDEKDQYFSLTVCYLRSKLILIQKKSSELITAGNLNKKYKKPWFQALFDAFKNKLIN